MTVSQVFGLFGSSLAHLYEPNECKAICKRCFEHYINYSSTDFLLKQSNELLDNEFALLSDALNRLGLGEPLQYVLGKTWFMDVQLDVQEGVLIPRPETEELINWIVTDYEGKTPNVLDVGTGSGCVAILIANSLKGSKVSAWDVSQDALTIAKGNADNCAVKVDFELVDVLNVDGNMLSKRFDVIVSNPPYVTMAEKQLMHTNVLNYEPHLALFVEDNDPLLFYRTIAILGKQLLNDGGCLYFEINEQFGHEMVEMLNGLGYVDAIVRNDMFNKPRMVKALLRLN